MASNEPKRPHYIPQMLLRNFGDSKDRLWAYDNTRAKLFPTAPTNLFVKKDLTTRYIFDDTQESRTHEEFLSSVKKSYEYEEHLGKIESRAAPAIRQIIKEARRSKCPKLSPKLSDAWKRFALALARRTPESQERVSSGNSFDDVFYNVVKTTADENNVLLSNQQSFYEDTGIRFVKGLIETNVNARFAAGVDHDRLVDEDNFCRETGIHVAIIRIPDRNFIIGSHGIAIVESSYKGDPVHGGWFPIAHDVAVQATYSPEKESLAILDKSGDGDRIITAINRATAEKSWLIAGRSEGLIRSFMQG